jgi:hypothetical protein
MRSGLPWAYSSLQQGSSAKRMPLPRPMRVCDGRERHPRCRSVLRPNAMGSLHDAYDTSRADRGDRLACCAHVERPGRDRRPDVSGGVDQHAPPLPRGDEAQRAGAGRTWGTCPPWRAVRCVCAPSARGSAQRHPLVARPVRSPPRRLDPSLHRLSVAALQSEGQHWTLRHGPARQVYSDYSHYAPRRAAGMGGSRLRCISPACYPRRLLLDQSATIGYLCINPTRMWPL